MEQMDAALPLFKATPPPESDAKSQPTTMTPDNAGKETPLTAQLSDAAGMPPSAFAIAAEAAPEGDFSEGVVDGDGMNRADTLDPSRQHHLLRHSLPTECRGSEALVHFGCDTVADAAKIIKKLSQRDLQAKFKAVYGARTFSNNNNWLRRKLFEAIGLDPSKGAVKKPGAGGTQRRRRPAKAPSSKPSGPRAPRRGRAELEMDQHNVAEALLALGEAAWMASQEEEESEGLVPTASYAEGDDAAQGRGSQSWSDGGDEGSPNRDVPSMEIDNEDAQQASVKTEEEEEEVVAGPSAAPVARLAPRPINDGANEFAQAFSQGFNDVYAAMAAELQRAAGVPAGLPFAMPHPPLMMAAHPQLAMMHAMMSGAVHPSAAAAMPPAGVAPEIYQRMLAEHPMAMMHKLMHGVPVVPPVFSTK